MDLQEFVRQSLCQIVRGVEAAQKDLKDTPARIAPMHVTKGAETFCEVDERGYFKSFVSTAEFDVAVIASEETTKGGGLKIAGRIVNVGGKAESDKCNQTVSRIKFSVPLVLPPEAK